LALRPDSDTELVLAGLLSDLRGRFDPFLIKQAVAALTHHALANSPKGRSVTLTAKGQRGSVDMILFVVEDSGPPMPDALRLHLLSGHPLTADGDRAKPQLGLYQLSVAQRIALATGSLLAFERTEAGTNQATLGVRNLPGATHATGG
jgi:K+-sensing histidine kinase KdpD